MMKVLKKIFLSITVACLLIISLSGNKVLSAEDPTSQISDIKECKDNKISIAGCPAFLEQKVNDLSGQVNTLASQVAVMDNQIRLTEARIAANQYEITNLTLDIDTADKKIDNLQESLDNLSQALVNRIKSTYIVGAEDPFHVLLSSSDASNFFKRLNYLKIAQAHDRRLIAETTAAKNDYENQKGILEDKKKQIESLKKQLEAYSKELDGQKQSKKTLLAETQGNEANYQQLLAQARTQLSALSNFATSRFGTSLVPHQELSDGWGRYYNQRDASWGNNTIGSSSETISAVGCLLTSYAMVVTHFGGSISPPDVAANTGNFWFSTALFLKPGPSASGHSATAVNGPSLQQLRDALNSGKAVIAGLSYDGGPVADHWVVLIATDGDSFRINDPLYQGAMNVSINDHYAGLSIVEARIYQ